MATGIPPVQITDPTFLPFHRQREFAYEETKTVCKEMMLVFEKSLQELGAFGTDVNYQGSLLQNEKMAIPEQEKMENQLETFLVSYWDFKSDYRKTACLTESIQNTITFLKHKFILDDVFLKEAQQLLEQIKVSEERAEAQMKELTEYLGKLESTRDKMAQVFSSTVDWPTQRYAQIVENKGHPLASTTRASNNLFAYSIPKPESTSKKTLSQSDLTSKNLAQITDPILLPFHRQREFVYQETKTVCEKITPIFEKHLHELGAFSLMVDNQGSVLQNEKIEIPAQEEMEKQLETSLISYWTFKNDYRKTVCLVESVQNTINFLMNKSLTYIEESFFKEAPDLLEQMKISEKIVLGQIKELTECLGKIESIRDKMSKAFKAVDWSTNRYAQIVENKGQPLGYSARFCNNIYSYNIPKPKFIPERPSLHALEPVQLPASSNTFTDLLGTFESLRALYSVDNGVIEPMKTLSFQEPSTVPSSEAHKQEPVPPSDLMISIVLPYPPNLNSFTPDAPK